MRGIYFRLGPLEVELSEGQAENVTMTLFFTMIAASVLTGLVLLH